MFTSYTQAVNEKNDIKIKFLKTKLKIRTLTKHHASLALNKLIMEMSKDENFIMTVDKSDILLQKNQ